VAQLLIHFRGINDRAADFFTKNRPISRTQSRDIAAQSSDWPM
jgi:hypothetical protein